MLPPDKRDPHAKPALVAFADSGFSWCSRRDDKEGQAVIPLAKELQSKSKAASPPSPAKEVQEGTSLAIKYERAQLRIRVLERDGETTRAELAKTIEAAEKLTVDNQALRNRADQCSVFEVAASTARGERGEALQRAASAEQRLQEMELQLQAVVQERDILRLDGEEAASQHKASQLSASALAEEFGQISAQLNAECDAAQKQLGAIRAELEEARSQHSGCAGAEKKAAVQLQQAHAKIKALQASLEAERMQKQESENSSPLKIFAGVSAKLETAAASWTVGADMTEVNSLDPEFTIDDVDLPLSQILDDVHEKLETASASWTPWEDIDDAKSKVDSVRAAIAIREKDSDFGAA